MMTEREKRIGANEVVFRELNEQLSGLRGPQTTGVRRRVRVRRPGLHPEHLDHLR